MEGFAAFGNPDLFRVSLGTHHVNETVSADQRLLWDVAFIAWGVLMIVIGTLLLRAAK
jgi:uncharacterized membrane protein